MEGEGGAEGLWSVALLGEFEVFPKEVAVGGIDAMGDDGFGAFSRVFTAEVRDAVLGDEDLDGVLAVVHV